MNTAPVVAGRAAGLGRRVEGGEVSKWSNGVGAASQTKMAWWAWDQVWCPQDPPGQMGPGAHGILTQKHQADQTRETTAGCSQSTPSELTTQGPGTRSSPKWAEALTSLCCQGRLWQDLSPLPKVARERWRRLEKAHLMSKASLHPSSL